MKRFLILILMLCATTAYLFFTHLIVEVGMSRAIWKQQQIFYPIIILYAIYMMNNFFRRKVSSNMPLHYKTVFKNIAIFITSWMDGIKTTNIKTFSISFLTFSVFPKRMIYPFFKTSGVLLSFFFKKIFTNSISSITLVGAEKMFLVNNFFSKSVNNFSANFTWNIFSFFKNRIGAFRTTINSLRPIFSNKYFFTNNARFIHCFIICLLVVFCQANNALSESEWLKTRPAATDQKIDYPVAVKANNEALDRLLSQYPKGITLSYSSATTIVASTGGVVCSDATAAVRKMRNNTSTTNITFADLDTGSEAASTTYYVYANCDADAATATFKISASSTTPTGVTSYKRIGSIYNDASSNITLVDNDNFSGEFGNYDSKSNNTVYQATTDGFIFVNLVSTGPYNYCYSRIYVDAFTPPTTIRGYLNTHEDTDWDRRSTYDSAMIPVKRGDYWKVVYTAAEGSSTQTIYWMPIQ